MAVDWKTTGTRGIPTNPYLFSGLAPLSPFMQGGPTQPGVGGTGLPNPAMLGGYGTPYGLSGVDQIPGGYGFSFYGFPSYGAQIGNPVPFATQFGNAMPFSGSMPGPYATPFPMSEQISDQDLERLVEEVLGIDPFTCNADIQVQCQDHVVTLTGTVPSKLVKISAGNDVWLVPGVRDVNNTIQIKSRTQHGKKQQTQRETVGVGSR